jgi:FkbM family methyltransferase
MVRSPTRAGSVEPDGDEIVHLRGSRIRLFVDRGSLIERILLSDHIWEPVLHTRLRFALSPGDTFVDCGANVGAHACVLAEHVGTRGRVVAIEPVPELADRLARNVALNGLRNVSIVRKAAAAEAGRRQFYAPAVGEDNQGQGSFYTHEGTGQRPIEVETEPLDDILARLGGKRVTAIKIDVEGAELDVLRGATRTLALQRPVVFFEYHPAAWDRAGATMEDLRDLLVDGCGYTLQRLSEGSGATYDVEATPPETRQRWSSRRWPWSTR